VFWDSRTGVSSDLSLPFPKVFKLSGVRWLVDNEWIQKSGEKI
jgi:hypothetical protein